MNPIRHRLNTNQKQLPARTNCGTRLKCPTANAFGRKKFILSLNSAIFRLLKVTYVLALIVNQN